jgi:hypothetical protein
MDPFTMTLATNAVAILSPFIKKGAVAFVNELASKMGGDAAKVTVNKVKGLFDRIKSKFTGDDEAVDALRRFEEKPDRYSSTLKDILKEKLEQDKDFAMELDNLVKEINLDIVIKMDEGKEVTGLRAKQMRSGRANVNMEIKKGEKITGADIEKMRQDNTATAAQKMVSIIVQRLWMGTINVKDTHSLIQHQIIMETITPVSRSILSFDSYPAT